jgi:hypothetical protein
VLWSVVRRPWVSLHSAEVGHRCNSKLRFHRPSELSKSDNLRPPARPPERGSRRAEEGRASGRLV